MAENLKLPTPAEYIQGRAGAQVLLDPFGYMAFKSQQGQRRFYDCVERKKLKCLVTVSVDIQTDMVVKVSNGTLL